MNNVFQSWSNRQDAYSPACGSSNQWSQEQNLKKCGYGTSDKEVTAIGLQRPLVGEYRTMRDEINYKVILFSILGEVFPAVIKDVVRAKRAHKVQLAGVIHAGHLSPV